jgi:hypothetical protein
MITADGFRELIGACLRRARAIRCWCVGSNATKAEMSGITLLKEWLSAEQLAQFESHSFFDVIGKHSGKRYRIRYGTKMNVTQIDSRGNVEGAYVSFRANPSSQGTLCWRKKSRWKRTNGAPWLWRNDFPPNRN